MALGIESYLQTMLPLPYVKKMKRSNENISPRSVSDVDWNRIAYTEEAVLCFIREGDRLLLIHKKTGLGAGLINGPGGRIEPGETPLEAAVRETREETGLTPQFLEHVGELAFVFTDGYSLYGYVFFAFGHEGLLTETEEADPFWCAISDIPYDRMWEDDGVWLPRVLNGERVKGYFIYDGEHALDHRVEPL